MDIRLEDIEPNPWNPRTTYEDSAMQELTDSIKRFGILQPICVRPHPTIKGKYQIIYGQRRWVACKRLGLKTIPVKEPIAPISDKDAIDIMGDENIKRQAYSPVELAKYFRTRKEIFGETQLELAEKYEVSHDTISLIEKLDKLPEEIKPKVTWETPVLGRGIERVRKPSIPFTHAVQLTRIPSREKQLEIAKKIEEEALTGSQVRKEVEKELGIERVEIPLPPLSEQIHDKVMWNLGRIEVQSYKFFTIGYSERSIEQFVEILKSVDAKTLLDVREEPFSIYKPDFNKESLGKTMEQNAIKYVHCPELGVPKERRLKLARSENWIEFFEYYDENILPRLEESKLKTLASPIAIMCVELDPTKCHRHRIALELEKWGWRGLDL